KPASATTDAIILDRTVHYLPTGPVVPASPLEQACIERLLACLRSKKPDLPSTAAAVLTQLNELAASYEQRLGSANEAALPAQEGDAQRTPVPGDKGAAIRGAARGVASSAKRVVERVQRARSDAGGAGEGQAGSTPAPRKRSNGR